MKILYVCNDLEYFIAHRLKLALSMRDLGHQVGVACGRYQRAGLVKKLQGLDFFPTELERHRFSLTRDIQLVWRYISILKQVRPQVVHTITIKPNLYMGIALVLDRLMSAGRQTGFVMTFAGLGKIFEPGGGLLLAARKQIVKFALKQIARLTKAEVTFENAIDRETMVAGSIFAPSKTTVLMGAGIDRGDYFPTKKTGEFSIAFASRLINAKGIDNFIAAAIAQKKEGSATRCVIAGPLDKTNPDCLDREILNAAIENGAIEYLGEIDGAGMSRLLRKVDVVCLPTRLREGFPRILLEAAACGCALIASDQPVMHQILRPGKTGWLLADTGMIAIARAFAQVAENPHQTRAMGAAAARLANTLPIDDKSIASKMLEIYSR